MGYSAKNASICDSSGAGTSTEVKFGAEEVYGGVGNMLDCNEKIRTWAELLPVGHTVPLLFEFCAFFGLRRRGRLLFALACVLALLEDMDSDATFCCGDDSPTERGWDDE